jgi:hypothetical protein
VQFWARELSVGGLLERGLQVRGLGSLHLDIKFWTAKVVSYLVAGVFLVQYL